ncbi:ABC1 family protein [Besnoitia besnoiti]|uniref:ABC1 family protein n=1 Tax=Besnoitia besnoiti TaxID=94643 RepID=A0A2A9MQ47_BESBE|nr:ABC1 family protein [Besnoitia besnoiti]PFH38293.1 ABC1 family protein [Besnoitia besnoiti]
MEKLEAAKKYAEAQAGGEHPEESKDEAARKQKDSARRRERQRLHRERALRKLRKVRNGRRDEDSDPEEEEADRAGSRRTSRGGSGLRTNAQASSASPRGARRGASDSRREGGQRATERSLHRRDEDEDEARGAGRLDRGSPSEPVSPHGCSRVLSPSPPGLSRPLRGAAAAQAGEQLPAPAAPIPRVSALDLIRKKPHVMDPLLYDSRRIVSKNVPPTNGRFTAYGLARLYAAIAAGEILDSATLEAARTPATVDGSLETLLLTGGGSRVWGLGYQLYECTQMEASHLAVPPPPTPTSLWRMRAAQSFGRRSTLHASEFAARFLRFQEARSGETETPAGAASTPLSPTAFHSPAASCLYARPSSSSCFARGATPEPAARLRATESPRGLERAALTLGANSAYSRGLGVGAGAAAESGGGLGRRSPKGIPYLSTASANAEGRRDGGTVVGFGHGDFGGSIALCFPELKLSIAILVNDVLTGPQASREILEFILRKFGLEPRWSTAVDFEEVLANLTPKQEPTR